MKKIAILTGAALLAASLSGAAFGQTGGNMNAPEPNATGTKVIQPGTTSTGTAVDAKKGSGTTGMNDKSGMGAKDGMKNGSKTPDNK